MVSLSCRLMNGEGFLRRTHRDSPGARGALIRRPGLHGVLHHDSFLIEVARVIAVGLRAPSLREG